MIRLFIFSPLRCCAFNGRTSYFLVYPTF